MSIVLPAKYLYETVIVEITREGNIYFPENDIEYELSLAEFGEEKTTAILLYDEWIENPIGVLCHNLFDTIGSRNLALIAADWAEHVLHFFETAFPKDRRPRAAIKAIRDFYSKHYIQADTKKTLNDVEAAENEAENLNITAYLAAGAARTALYVLYLSERTNRTTHAVEYDIKWAGTQTSWNAFQAYAQSFQPGASDLEREAAKKVERDWQIRRFVDCMEAVQAEKPWPPLKVTK